MMGRMKVVKETHGNRHDKRYGREKEILGSKSEGAMRRDEEEGAAR